MTTIRPWKLFSCLAGTDPFARLVTLPLPFRQGSDIQTIMSLETMLLIAVARMVEAKTMIEFGTSVGATALNMVMNVPDLQVVTVDKDRRQRDYDDTVYRQRVVEIHGDLADFLPSPADLVFQDINYSGDLVEMGTWKAVACEPKVIAWHDYGHPNHPYVKEFIDSLAFPLYHVEDSWLVFWFKNPPEALR